MSRRTGKKSNRGITRGILACAIGIIVVTGGVFLWNGVIHRDGPKPAQVEGLEAAVCYHDITLTWAPAKKAAGYYIYAAEGGSEAADPAEAAKAGTGTGVSDGDDADAAASGQTTGGADPDFGLIGEVAAEGDCSFEVDAYTHDKPYRFKVAAYGYNPLTKNKNEGDASQEVEAMYDSSQYAQKIPVLTYHDLVPTGYEIVNGLTVPEDAFAAQMEFLNKGGYKTLSLDEFYQWYQGKLEVPNKSCVVTFDDGAYEIYYLAYPILKRNGQSATEFCIGHHLAEVGENTAPYTPEDGIARRFGTDVLEELRTEYPQFACESHTYNMHKRIDGYKPVNKYTYEEMMEDFRLNEPYDFHYLAYPWGASNKNMRKAAKDSGYKLAFGYGPFRYARRTDDQYNIRRIKVSAYYSMETFQKIVDGSWEEEAEE